MKLIALECNKSSFKKIHFNPNGLTLIVGDGSIEKKSEGNSNGAGKTLALKLIQHCLGANANTSLASAVPDWMFRLTFRLGREEHQIARSGDGKIILLNDRQINIKPLREWLNSCGVFRMDPSLPGLSFRSLFKRFARYELDDCIDPLKTKNETPFDSLLRSLYLLGVDCSLVVSKRNNKIESDSINKAKKNWQEDKVLQDIFRGGAEPKVRAEWLDRELPRLQSSLEKFQVAENYRAIEHEANELTQLLRQFEKDKAVLLFQLAGIEKALEEQPDISRTDLLQLYNGLEAIFKPEVLTHFEKVEEFHASLAVKRKNRLAKDKLFLQKKVIKLEESENNISKKRDELLQSLHGKRALDEYASLAQQIAAFREERQRLHSYLNLSATLQEKAQKIKEDKVEEDRIANAYLQKSPLIQEDAFFKTIAEQLYPRTPAGIVLESNDGDNQIRYNLKVHIEGQESDGINAARILCFDILLLMHGHNHTLDLLWHDNRFFADIAPGPRAAWFRHLIQNLPGTGKQYVATINTENYSTMSEYLSGKEWEVIQKSVNLVLRGDRPENKLLGIQFGGS
jgi:uncharacterized protein YydD (DUF2326 family)